MLDPEQLGGRLGFACPHCGHQLSGKDLFGVAAAFSEEEQPELSLEDLMKPDGGVGTPQDLGGLPHATQQALRREASASQSRAKQRGHVVHLPGDDDDDDTRGGSALDLMRKMKKRS
jgi:hypothetical protein